MLITATNAASSVDTLGLNNIGISSVIHITKFTYIQMWSLLNAQNSYLYSQWRIWSLKDVMVRSWYTHSLLTWNTSMQHHFEAAHLTHHDIKRWGHTVSWLWVPCELAEMWSVLTRKSQRSHICELRVWAGHDSTAACSLLAHGVTQIDAILTSQTMNSYSTESPLGHGELTGWVQHMRSQLHHHDNFMLAHTKVTKRPKLVISYLVITLLDNFCDISKYELSKMSQWHFIYYVMVLEAYELMLT